MTCVPSFTLLIHIDLYLIKPPPDAHQPVNPAHIVVGGDSAGGGITLALLQVLRDTGQPLPAGGVLISPWCDLTHSFPSVHANTATVISGFSFQNMMDCLMESSGRSPSARAFSSQAQCFMAPTVRGDDTQNSYRTSAKDSTNCPCYCHREYNR